MCYLSPMDGAGIALKSVSFQAQLFLFAWMALTFQPLRNGRALLPSSISISWEVGWYPIPSSEGFLFFNSGLFINRIDGMNRCFESRMDSLLLTTHTSLRFPGLFRVANDSVRGVGIRDYAFNQLQGAIYGRSYLMNKGVENAQALFNPRKLSSNISQMRKLDVGGSDSSH